MTYMEKVSKFKLPTQGETTHRHFRQLVELKTTGILGQEVSEDLERGDRRRRMTRERSAAAGKVSQAPAQACTSRRRVMSTVVSSS